MDIVRSFSYMFKDSTWFFKVFLGGIFLLASAAFVGLPLILGYEIEHIREAAEQKESLLPEWKNIRRFFKEGFIVLSATLIYAGALMLLIAAVHRSPTASLMLAVLLAVIFFWMPLLLIQFTKRPTFLSCFSILEIVKRCAVHPFLFSVSLATGFLTIAASVLFGWMSMIVGWPFVVFWGILVQSHILGQLAKL
jgi:hypothetical protein